ncbi:MAG: pyrroloquinoline quinone biosynthesis protein PqqB [Myxococcota bacterium]
MGQPRLRVVVLGSAAGGGVPQWNCRCMVCEQVRRSPEGGTGPDAPAPRTQLGLAVSADGERWVLLGASPDLREQLLRTPALWPSTSPRHSPIAAVVLTGADVDHVAGLLVLREGHPFALHAPPRVHEALRGSRIFDVLPEGRVPRRTLPLNEPSSVTDATGSPTGIRVEAFAVPGKVPLYLERPDEAPPVDETGHAIGLRVGRDDGAAHFHFVASCAALSDSLARRLRGAPLVLFDGTLFRDDELRAQGVGHKTGRRMGHMSMSGPDGSMRQLAPLGIRRKVFVHVNNTNPALPPGSSARREIESAGWEVAFDGMALDL